MSRHPCPANPTSALTMPQRLSARASTAHLDAAALLLLAFAALVAFGVGMARYGAATVRHHRSVAQR